jgi:hypothetical protein
MRGPAPFSFAQIVADQPPFHSMDIKQQAE